ncbi:MAG: aminoacyl-tRNA hydrolase [Flavobacteriaceae bacterium]
MKKFLIVGLGNIGTPYHNTRHNIGFRVLDTFAEKKDLTFEDLRYGAISKTRFKGKSLILLKPSTLMNRSGKAVRYWALKENIQLQNILIITDDLNLPFGALRLKPKGSDGGHNGLKDIEAQLNTPNYPRLRFGIHSEEKGYDTVNFVLGKWSETEEKQLNLRVEKTIEQTLAFVSQGIQEAMNQFNGS